MAIAARPPARHPAEPADRRRRAAARAPRASPTGPSRAPRWPTARASCSARSRPTTRWPWSTACRPWAWRCWPTGRTPLVDVQGCAGPPHGAAGPRGRTRCRGPRAASSSRSPRSGTGTTRVDGDHGLRVRPMGDVVGGHPGPRRAGHRGRRTGAPADPGARRPVGRRHGGAARGHVEPVPVRPAARGPGDADGAAGPGDHRARVPALRRHDDRGDGRVRRARGPARRPTRWVVEPGVVLGDRLPHRARRQRGVLRLRRGRDRRRLGHRGGPRHRLAAGRPRLRGPARADGRHRRAPPGPHDGHGHRSPAAASTPTSRSSPTWPRPSPSWPRSRTARPGSPASASSAARRPIAWATWWRSCAEPGSTPRRRPTATSCGPGTVRPRDHRLPRRPPHGDGVRAARPAGREGSASPTRPAWRRRSRGTGRCSSGCGAAAGRAVGSRTS